MVLVLLSCGKGLNSRVSKVRSSPLNFINLKHINSINVREYSFSGNCLGQGEQILKYVVRRQVEEEQSSLDNIEDTMIVYKGSTPCQNETWQVNLGDVSSIPPGQYSIEVTLGLLSTNSIIIKDTDGPEITLLVDIAEFFTGDQLDLEGSCDEDGELTYKLIDQEDSSSLQSGQATCTAGVNWSVSINLEDIEGAIAVVLEFKDHAENPAPTIRQEFQRDTTPPTATLNATAINGRNQANWQISGTCSEEGRSVTISISIASINDIEATCTNNEWTGSASMSSTSDGESIDITLTHDDAAGYSTELTRNIMVDLVSPSISTTQVPDDGTYNAGFLDFTITFDEEVVVTGIPRLILTEGGSTFYANYNPSASSASNIVFRYIILSGDTSNNNGLTLGASIDLNTGTIKDIAGNNAAISPLGISTALTGINVEGSAISLSDVTSTNGYYNSGKNVTLSASFGQPVLVTGTPRLVLDVGGSTAYANYDDDRTLKDGHNFNYLVADTENDSNGIEVVGIDLNGGSIRNNATPVISVVSGVLPASIYFAGVKVDTVVPVVSIQESTSSSGAPVWVWGCDSIEVCTFRFAFNNNANYSFSSTTDFGNTIFANLPSNLAAGDYFIHVQGKDEAGNRSSVVRMSFTTVMTSVADYAFNNRGLTTVTIHDTVVSIGNYAYSNNQLTSVTIPNSVTSIGNSAFSNNQLTSVTIPDSVTSIGDSAFSDNQLTSVTIPDSVTSIGDSTFSNNQLTSVTIPDGVTSIGYDAFDNNQLVSVTIPDSVTLIKQGAFRNNPNLTSFTVSFTTGTTSIGDYAFHNFPLTTVTIPDGVTSIGNYSFLNNQLVSVSIPDSVTSIGRGAFSSNQLMSLTIPNGVVSIEADAFNSNQLTSVIIPDTIVSMGQGAFGNNPDLASLTLSFSAGKTSIGDGAFSDFSLTSVIIPNGVTSIGNSAFSNNRLNSAIIPDGIITLGNSAFTNNQLTSITIPGSVTSIGVDAFSNNQLASITILSGVTSIGESAFSNNQLTTVTIPDTVTSIGQDAFRDNLNLTSFTLSFSAGRTSIEDDAFSNFPLTSLTIPSGVTSIGERAFINNQLTSVTIPDTVTSIGENAFRNSSISTFTLSFRTGITSIEDSAFDNFPLTTVTIPNSVRTIGDYAFNSNQLTSATIPNSVITIGDYAFRFNRLTAVTIPDSVTHLGNHAFDGNQLSSVTLSNGMTSIGDFAFYTERNLKFPC